MKKLSLLSVVIVAVLTISSCKRNNGCNFSEKGWVRDYSTPENVSTDTCGILIELEDGMKLEPTNLASFDNLPYNEGDLVWVSYKEVSGTSTCGLGEVVKLRCIVEREF